MDKVKKNTCRIIIYKIKICSSTFVLGYNGGVYDEK